MEKLIGVSAGSAAAASGLCKKTIPAGTVFEAASPNRTDAESVGQDGDNGGSLSVTYDVRRSDQRIILYETVTFTYEPKLVGEPAAGTCEITVPSGSVDDNALLIKPSTIPCPR